MNILFLALCACAGARGSTSPWKATFATPDPVAAKDFVVKYLGGKEIPQPHHGGNGTCALIKWVQFDSDPPYQMHFVNAFDKRIGDFTLQDFAKYVEHISGNISTGHYNQYMDNHVGLRVSNADPYIAKLKEDKVPFFTRKQTASSSGCDVFIMLPNNGIIVELKSDQCSETVVHGWDFCQPDIKAELALQPLPTAEAVIPWKMTYASSDPDAAADFCIQHLGAININQHVSNGTCATIRWVRFPNANASAVEYQLHFVHNPYKDAGKMSLEQYEQYLIKLHGNISETDGATGNGYYDQFMDNHVGLMVDSITPHLSHFQANKIPYFTRGQQGTIADIFVEIPGGIIFEFAHKGADANATGLTPWDMCEKPRPPPPL